MEPDWKEAVAITAAFLLMAAVLVLAGCSTQVPVPERPAMPTESLDKGVGIDTFIAACIAEIERREGYEIKLRAAIAVCNGDKD